MSRAGAALVATRMGAVLLGAALAAACGGKPRPAHYYQLRPRPAAETPPDLEGSGLPRLEVGIPAFHVDPPYDRAQIARRAGDGGLELGFYTDRLWVAPLAKMLPVVVGEDLMSIAGAFVSAGPPGGRPLDATIEGRVLSLEEVLTPQGSSARCRMRLTLRRRNGEAVWSGVAEGEATAASREPAAMAEALQSALTSGLDTTRPSLVGALLGLARGSVSIPPEPE